MFETAAQKLQKAVGRDIRFILDACMPDDWGPGLPLPEPALRTACLHPIEQLKLRLKPGEEGMPDLKTTPTFCKKCGVTLTPWQVELRAKEYIREHKRELFGE